MTASSKKSKEKRVTIKYSGHGPDFIDLRLDKHVWAIRSSATITSPIRIVYRQMTTIPTDLQVQVEEGYQLMFQLAESLVEKGLMVANAPACFSNGKIEVMLVNVGREIVEVAGNDFIGRVSLVPMPSADWVGGAE